VGRLIFDLQQDGRAKTGRAAFGTLSKRTERLVSAYLDTLGIELHPEAILFRNRSGAAYRAETLAHDFAALRELVFPGDKRRLMDMLDAILSITASAPYSAHSACRLDLASS
jgi:hypothetical protein